ncbi:MAG TPA: acyl-CoA thioesterase, partial [Brevundimonas sp.]
MARSPLQPREDREVFTLPLTILPEHIDGNGHVNNVVYVGWLQEAGTAHWNARFDEQTRAKWSWVALRHEIDYLRGLMPDSTAVARTWVGDPQGPRFARFVRIEDEQGRVCAQGHSEWVLVDAAT